MDLLDFADDTLYFEEPLAEEAATLLVRAANEYGDASAEMSLLRAHLLAPDSLTVLVGIYRYYFYQHRLEDALQVAERAMQLSGRRLGLPAWDRIDDARLAAAAASSFGMLRFYLLALKAASVVLLRLGRIAESRERLCKLAALDSRDQLGAGKLLEVVDAFRGNAEEDEDIPDLKLVAA